ncbi:DUF6455 family protein [Sedimentitalea sp. XS_ASV28]|uniref:DUF6455 family protein n=1 Tax=Sedimentitalea sp. XS_ASV28 TaxID=3241296 RepID=UPI0035177FBE
MGILSKLGMSTDLVNGMAERLRAGIPDLIARDPQRYAPMMRTMAIRCSGCSAQANCRSLQARSSRLDAAPMYCVNKTALDALRRRR